MTSLPYRGPAATDCDFPGVSQQSVSDGCSATRSELELPISTELISHLSEGDHHDSPAVPATGTVLPPRDEFQRGLSCVHTYLQTAGAAVLADLHLEGLGAPVVYSTSDTVFAYIDCQLFESLITDVLVSAGCVTRPLEAGDTELIDAIISVHNMEFTQQLQSLEQDPLDVAKWPSVRGKQTPSATGFVFTSPHPFQDLQNHPHLSERAIALVGGIQHLTLDIESVGSQTDVALIYLLQYLRSEGVSEQTATDIVSSWYDVEPECVSFVVEKLHAHLTTEAISTSDPEFKYYLTESVSNSLFSESLDW